MEDLLQESDLTLSTTIKKCQGQEAAKRQRSDMAHNPQETISALRKPFQNPKNPPTTCPGCGRSPHQRGRKECPAFGRTCHFWQNVGHFAKACRAKRQQTPPPPTIKVTSTSTTDSCFVKMPNVQHLSTAEPAPTIRIHVASLNGSADVEVLPDSGADISAAGEETLHLLGEHPSNLLPSTVVPRAVNGTTMKPQGKIMINLQLGTRKHCEDLHVYPGMLISWRAAKGLGILPQNYPHPEDTNTVKHPNLKVANASHPPKREELMDEFPAVFDGCIRTMEGETFHISLKDAKPFCVNTPRSIPFAYRDKLKSELELLKTQGIITPVTEATDWCAPIVVTPKRTVTASECVWISPTSTDSYAVNDISQQHQRRLWPTLPHRTPSTSPLSTH